MHCLIVDDVILINEKGLLHPRLQEFYNAYRAEHGTRALPPREWISRASGKARMWIARRLRTGEALITADVPSQVLVRLGHLPLPSRFKTPAGALNERFHELVRYLQRDDISRKLWDRLSVLDNPASDAAIRLRTMGEVGRGHLNILKGNVVEVFSMPLQIARLATYRSIYPQAMLITGIRVRFAGAAGPARLFSDNIIGTFLSSGNLAVHHLFEVKGSLNAFVDGDLQVVRWHHRLGSGVELHVPRTADVFGIPRSGETSGILRSSLDEHLELIEPGVATRVGDDFTYAHNMPGAETRTIDLRTSSRDIVTVLAPRGQSSMGLQQLSSAAPDVMHQPMTGVSQDEVEYLMAYLMQNR
jgi:hypothetical protein